MYNYRWPHLAPPPVAKAIADYDAVRADADRTELQLSQAKIDLGSAQREHKAQVEAAVQAGESTPADPTATIEGKVRELEGRLAAAETVGDRLERVLLETVEEHSDEWAAALEATAPEIAISYSLAVGQLLGVRDQREQVESAVAFLRRYPDRRMYNPATPRPLRSAGGSAIFDWSAIHDALQRDAALGAPADGDG